MLTAQRKTTAAAQRSKASVPQPAAVLPHKPRGAVVANANLGDAAKGMTSAALAAALLLGGAPQPAHAEFNKEAVENLNRSGAEVSKTIQENTPDLPSITGGVVNKTINKVKESLGVEDNSSNLKSASDRSSGLSSGILGATPAAQDNLKRASNKTNDYNPLTSGNSNVQTGEKISAEGGKFTGLFQADTAPENTAEKKVNQNQLLNRGVSVLPAPSPIADLAAIDGQDVKNAGRDLKNAAGRAADSVGAAGAAAKDYSAELRRVGIEAKRGDGLTGAFFNKSNNGKIDITKGTYDSVEDAGRDAKANLQRVGDKANDSLGGLKRAADKAADKAKDLVSQAPSGYTVLGDIADAGQDLKNAGRKAADNIGAAGAAAKDYSAELRRVGIEAKRGDGLTGAFRKANNGKIDITKGTYNSIEDAASDAQRGLDRAGSAAQRGLDRATNKAGDVLNVKSNPIDSVKRAADKAADKAKDLVSQAPTGWTYLGDIADAGQDLKNAAGRAADKIGAAGSGSKDRSAELRRVGIEAKRGAGLTGAFRNANQGYQSLPEGDADRVLTGGIKDAARQGQRGFERATEKANVLQNVTDSNPVDSVKRAAGKAADKAKDLVSQAPTGYTVLGDIADAGQDLKNAAGKAADNIGAAGAAANDRSAELRQVGVEAKRGNGLTGAFRKADNGKIDITKGGPNADDLVRAADKAAGNAKSAAKDLVSMAPQPLGDIADLPFARQPADKSDADGGLKGIAENTRTTNSAKEILDPSNKSPRLQNVQQDGSTVTRLTVNPQAGGFDKLNDARRDASRDPTKNDQRLEGVRGASQQIRDNIIDQSKTNALGASTVKGAVQSVKETLSEAAGGLAGGAENAKNRLQDAAESKGKLNPAAVAGREGGKQLSVSDSKNEREALRGAEDTREAGRKAAEGPLGIFKRG